MFSPEGMGTVENMSLNSNMSGKVVVVELPEKRSAD